MYTKTILIFFICSIIIIENKAQNINKLQGTIIDGITNLPIEGVIIKSRNNEFNAITNKLGHFSMIFINNLSNNDSIIINALGYKSIEIPISIPNNEAIKLYEDIVNLPEVIVQSIFNWDNFVKKIKLEFATTPFESDFQKSITIKKSSNTPKEYIFKGYAHDEGFTLEGLKGNIKGRSLNYGVFFNKFTDTAAFINYNGSDFPKAFTDFESGEFYWLLYLPTDKFKIATCKIIGLTTLGGDSIYVIKYESKIDKSKKLIDKINHRIAGRKIGNIYYFSLEKIFYIRKKDYTIVQIDFNQKIEISNADTSTNIKKIRDISGSIKFEYFNDTPHPIFLTQKYLYDDKYGNLIERNDKIYYSNIKMIKLSKAELKNKYQLAKIFQTYPRRQFNNLYYEKMGPFYNIPTIK